MGDLIGSPDGFRDTAGDLDRDEMGELVGVGVLDSERGIDLGKRLGDIVTASGVGDAVLVLDGEGIIDLAGATEGGAVRLGNGLRDEGGGHFGLRFRDGDAIRDSDGEGVTGNVGVNDGHAVLLGDGIGEVGRIG